MTQAPASAETATHDLVLKGGRVIDPSQGIDRVTDVAFSGGRVSGLGDGLTGSEIRDMAASESEPVTTTS